MRLLKGLLGLIITVVLLGVAGIGAVYVLVINDEDLKNQEIIDKNYSVAEVINNEMSTALIGSDNEDKDFKFLLDSYELESILYAVTHTIAEQIEVVTLNGIKVECVEDQFTLKASVSYKTFPTQIIAKLLLKEENGTFTIGIDKLSLSKIQLVGSLSKKLLSNVDTESLVQQIADNYHVYLDVDLDKLTITLTKENILKTIDEYVETLEPLKVGRLLVSMFLDNDSLLEFNMGKDDAFGAVLHLASLQYDATKNGPLPYTYDFDTIIKNEEQLLTQNTIKFDEVSVTFNYLVNGYDALEAEDKAIIDPIDFSSIGILVNSSYQGIVPRSNKTLTEKIEETLNFEELQNELLINHKDSFDVTITEGMLNDLINSTDFIGIGSAFAHNETNKIGYIAIDQIFLKSHKDSSQVFVVLNVHNTRICLEVDLNCPSTPGFKIVGTITKAYLGENELTEQNIDDLLIFLQLTLASSATEWVTIDTEAKQVTFDFESQVQSSSTVANVISSLSVLGKTYETTTSFEEGVVKVHYALVD